MSPLEVLGKLTLLKGVARRLADELATFTPGTPDAQKSLGNAIAAAQLAESRISLVIEGMLSAVADANARAALEGEESGS